MVKMTKQKNNEALKPIEPPQAAQDRPACRILTIAEVASILGKHRSSIERYIDYGGLPALRNRRRVFGIRQDDLDRWLETKNTPNITDTDFEF